MLRINTLGDEKSRPRYTEALQAYFEPYRDDLSETSRMRLARNPLRILDTKIEKERRLLEGAPHLIDYVDEESLTHYEEVKNLLQSLDIAFVEDPFLVRGLDYYTRTAFELESPRIGAQSSLAGGGRYDLLAEDVGSKQRVPAVGFAAGFERLFLALEAEDIDLPVIAPLDAFMIALGDEATGWVFEHTHRLRQEGLRVSYDLKGRSMKAQMRAANRLNARYVVIIAKDELSARRAQIKDMETSEQVGVDFDALVTYLHERKAAS